jgi:hypothetical protein
MADNMSSGNGSGFRRPKRLFFSQTGVDVNSPLDAPKRPHRVAKMKNMTVGVDGSLTTRPGIANLYAGLVLGGVTPCHSVRRISDDESGLWARVIGVGTQLACEVSTAVGTTTSIDTGYSSKPFTSAAWRPSESAKLHLYVGDDSRMRKVDVTGVDKQVGLPPPTTPPTVELDRSRFVEVSDMETAGAWAVGGTAGAATAANRVNTTLEAVVGAIYDSGATGWGCFRPLDLTNIGPGSLLDYITSGPTTGTVRVTEVHRAGTATTIGTIIYESGTSGICTIQPANAVAEFVRNAVVRIVNGGTTEYLRILAVVPGVNGGRCIRVRTSATFVAGNSLQVVNSFRAHCADGMTSGDTISKAYVQSVLTGSGTATLTDTVAVDLTYVTSGGSNAKPMYDSDYFSFSFWASDLSKITNIRVMFSLDGTFTENFYYRTIEQSVLVASVKNTQTAAEIRRRNRQQQGPLLSRTPIDFGGFGGDRSIDRFFDYTPPLVEEGAVPIIDGPPKPIPPSGETGTGDNQWSELRWTRRSCERAGTDQSRDWKDVSMVRIEVTTSAAITIRFNSLNANGGCELDVPDDGVGYQYRYRGRDSTTGVVSDYSPECLEQLIAYRDQAVVTLTQHPSPEVNKLDIERWGGSQLQWLLVGTVTNSASPSFTDNLSDLSALNNAPYSDQRVLQPWVRFGSPKSGTASIVAGNMVRDNGSNAINTDIVPGTRVIVNGIASSIRRIVNSTTWELADSIGSATNATWEMPIEVRAGRPLGAIWRHDVGNVGVMFACDGIYLRWTIGNNPDGTRSANYLEMTEANDPLVMGFSYNGRCGVFTTERLFWITGDTVNGFRADHVPDSDGLYSRWALAIGRKFGISWLSKNRINVSLGGSPDDVTSVDLGPLFADEEGGGAPSSVNGVRAPKIASTEAQYLRLDYADDGSLFFVYRDPTAARGCLRYVPRRESWLPYEFAKSVGFVYSEEGTGIRNLLAGGDDGKLYVVGGSANPNTDDGTGFAWEVQPFCEDFGDARPNKRFGDLEVDANPDGQTINVEVAYNNHTTAITALGTMTGAPQQQKLFDLSSGAGVRARNISVRLHGTTTVGSRPRLYSWEPSVLDFPADTVLRASHKHDAGYAGDKYMQGIVIHADTYNQPKTLVFKKDDGTTLDTITITHNGERRESYSFDITNDLTRIARLVWIETADTDPWTLIDWQWVYDIEPRAAKVWEIQYSGIDARDYFHVFQILLALRSTADTTMETYADNTLIATNTVSSTSGLLTKTTPIVLPAVKAKLMKWRLESSADIRLYERDCAIWAMPYAGSDYSILKPFGGPHRAEGAKI